MSKIDDYLSTVDQTLWENKDWVTYIGEDIVVIDYLKIYYFLPTPEVQELVIKSSPELSNMDSIVRGRRLIVHPLYAREINRYIADYLSEKITKKKFIIVKVLYETVPGFLEHAKTFVNFLGYNHTNSFFIASIGSVAIPHLEHKQFKIKTISNHCVNYSGWHDKLLKSNIDFSTIECDKYFLSLARRSSIEKAAFTRELLMNFSEISVVSLGFKHASYLANFYKKMMAPFPYPISAEDKEYIHHGPPSEFFYKCLINVVVETNCYRMHISEKTWKAFGWYQVPIIFGSKGIIKIVRETGFDVFDDILENHYYDVEEDKDVRMYSIINILKNFKKKYPTLDSVNQLRRDIFPRLEKNAALLKEYVDKEPDVFAMCGGNPFE